MIIRLATLGLGYGFIAFGVVGIILPVLHGTLFLVIGLAILSRREPWARAVLERLKRQHPRVRTIVGRGERLTQRWLRLATVKIGRLLRPARSL
jgi:uncharacterized membrane protein YbaN (DUF454 family)